MKINAGEYGSPFLGSIAMHLRELWAVLKSVFILGPGLTLHLIKQVREVRKVGTQIYLWSCIRR